MRSFLECVSCWGTTTHEVSMMEEVVTVAAKEEEETKSLMPAGTTAASRRKTDRVRVRVGSTGSMNPQWKPSLCSITEDNIMTENRKKTPSETPTRTVDRVVKRKSSSGPRSNVHVRSYSNETGRNSVPMFLPTFSPTPFMF